MTCPFFHRVQTLNTGAYAQLGITVCKAYNRLRLVNFAFDILRRHDDGSRSLCVVVRYGDGWTSRTARSWLCLLSREWRQVEVIGVHWHQPSLISIERSLVNARSSLPGWCWRCCDLNMCWNIM